MSIILGPFFFPMHEIHKITLSDLIDMLALHTVNYSKLLTEGGSDEEFNNCKQAIHALQAEITTRRQAGEGTPVKGVDVISYKQED